jgi:hypothetical protein
MGSYPFGPDSSAAELWLLDDPQRLLQLNRARANVWPRGFFALGTDGGELTYLLDTAAPPFPVLAFNLESGKLEPHAPSFPAFVKLLHDELGLIEADERATAEAFRNKKWWQFWIRL